ncbi:beta-lactamase family protein [Actinotalea sp. M2MS4P-6]|uniref:serine hydrolase domain-containing protein n=1 Tax=Actinotalea sp. M2MS4P-6 TaxID=2983762 RepID=UPI0021E4C594|nr:serine hydrolase [Actinotalea sp. M2MS4P-6]MCV2395660.1 beta-lactamase family protein [Actinotalea sp. M2MS4P-6]
MTPTARRRARIGRPGSRRRPPRPLAARRLRAIAATLACALPATVALAACGGEPDPTPEQLAAVDYAPGPDVEGWQVSTPEAQGLDPDLVADLYWRAANLETIYSLLVIKNGYLVAEEYYRTGSPTQHSAVASVTKSYTGALVGIALDEGCLPSLDEPMITYFPELEAQLDDPRKTEITIRQLLQMRAGYPWEEATAEGMELLYSRFTPASLVDVPLKRDPGSGWDYSNLSSHLLAIIVARACEDLMDFATEHLFDPLGIEPEQWMADRAGYRHGHADLSLSAREMARFGQTYLDGGVHDGRQVIPTDWIEQSWQKYTEDAWYYAVGPNWHSSYGYQWWLIDAGPWTYDLAWGHGGQQIAVLPEEDLVVVLKADPLWDEHGDGPWGIEKANLNLVANFVAGIPEG